MTSNSQERAEAYLKRSAIWHVISENPPVTSCAEAAANRKRLGHIGIPLCDELKSNVGFVRNVDGERIVVVHCRGHQTLDFEKLAALLGGEFERLTDEDLRSDLGVVYGQVSPIAYAERTDVVQVVDSSVFDPYYPPHTMMTNLSDLRRAVEFKPQELFDSMSNVLIDKVANDVEQAGPGIQCIGILTGNSPESGMHLWSVINSRIRSRRDVHVRGDLDFPRVLIDSVPMMGASMELSTRYEDVEPVVRKGVEGLCKSGAQLIAVACNTTQFFSPEIRTICDDLGASFVSIADVTAKFLRENRISTCDLLGIGAVTDLSKWSDFRRIANEFDIHVPAAKDLDSITDLAFSVKREVVSARTVNRLRDLVNRATTSDTVVLALTELSIVFASQKSGQRSTKRFIDTLELLGNEIADRYCNERIWAGAA